MKEAVKFLLEHVVQFGDAHASAKAKRFLQIVLEEEAADASPEQAALESLVQGLPHDGSQSPVEHTKLDMGGAEEAAHQEGL